MRLAKNTRIQEKNTLNHIFCFDRKKNGRKNTEPGSSILSLQKHSNLLIAYEPFKPLKKANEENRIEQPQTNIVIEEQIFS